jgi:poly(A) polymerase
VVEPVIISRAQHTISRRDIDPDALKVLYRLQQSNFEAYLVGGGVRDLLLGRRPKDFDIATNAHPYQIKKLFRNCWIIGRRFRLAHVKFGQKTIEVATFRKNMPDPLPEEADSEPVVVAASPDPKDGIIRRDNTFGTPEEDAFRRDFTVNALAYDIATYSIIDYVGGLADLEQRVIRSIGDPMVRFVEDPVRMFRAAVFSSRLGFSIDALVVDAIAELKPLIAQAAAPRLLEEYYKILRSGYAEASFRTLNSLGLLELMTPELLDSSDGPSDAVWDSLARLDAYRRRFEAAPPELTNAVLMGALLVPAGLIEKRVPGSAEIKVTFGKLPIARRDLDRLGQIVSMVPRLLEPDPSRRLTRSLPNRPAFRDTMLWLEIFNDAPEQLAAWEALRSASPAQASADDDGREGAREAGGPPGTGRRKRRRRRGRRRGGRGKAPAPTE